MYFDYNQYIIEMYTDKNSMPRHYQHNTPVILPRIHVCIIPNGIFNISLWCVTLYVFNNAIVLYTIKYI